MLLSQANRLHGASLWTKDIDTCFVDFAKYSFLMRKNNQPKKKCIMKWETSIAAFWTAQSRDAKNGGEEAAKIIIIYKIQVKHARPVFCVIEFNDYEHRPLVYTSVCDMPWRKLYILDEIAPQIRDHIREHIRAQNFHKQTHTHTYTRTRCQKIKL